MAKVTLKDLVDITHAGFTYQNVKELMTMEAPAELNSPQTQTEVPEVKNDISQSKEDTPVNTSSPEPKESPKAEAEPDYKALYEAEKEKVNALQNKNNRADVSTSLPTEADLLDLVKDYCK